MAMQSAYGNAAMARAATTGEISPKASVPAAAPVLATAATPLAAEKILVTPAIAAKEAAAPAAAPAPASVTEKSGTTVAPQPTPIIAGAPAPPPPPPAEAKIPSPAAPATAEATAAPATAAAAPAAAPATPGATAAGAPAKGALKPGAALSKEAGEKPAGEKAAKSEHAPAAKGAAPAGKGAPASAESDPAFQVVVHHAKAVAGHQAAHAPAHAKAEEAHAAAVSPGNEVHSLAAAKQTDKMEQQQPKPFDRAAFKVALLKKIADTAPKTLQQADDFKKDKKLDSVKSDLNSKVSQEKQQSQGDLAQATAEQPDSSGIEPKAVTPLPVSDAGQQPEVPAAGAAPKPQSDAAISLQEGPKEVDKQMADAGVTEEQLQHSNEPAFQGAVVQKKQAEQQSAQAPQDFRKQEQGMLAGARADAHTTVSKDVAAMHSSRKAALSGVVGHQTNSKAEEEKKRAEVSTHIEQIYEKTKKDVEARLKRLDDEVNKTFDDGASGAQAAFEDYVGARMDAYKDERYSGWLTGGAKWAKDKLFGMPDEVNEFYEKGHDQYLKQMDGVIDHVATMVETGLNEAKGIITAGKQEIQTYVQGLPAGLKEVGKKAAATIQSKFDALEQTVNDKQGQLVDSLAKKYNDNLAKINARIDEMKAANKGLIDSIKDAIKGIIQTIIDLKNMLLNTLSRAADAIGLIIAHPIDFLGHLIDAGKLGFNNFTDHILEHLKKGFMEWLFGAVAETGITLPEHFDLPGILSLVLQILGLTYANIRSRAVKILGEKVVKALETAAEIFKILITKGPAGLWEYIKEKIGDLKAMVIEKIKAFVMEKIITAGITWIIGLLNPASAFIKACKAIYDIIMFFVEHGKQIMALVNAIIDSITAIAKGAIGKAAAFVESSLAKTIPVVIGFLAALLGVGGISEKIKEVINAIREPINAAIDWVINKAVDIVKTVGGLLGFGKDEKVEKTNDPDHDAKVTAGLAAIDEEDQEREKEGKLSREGAEEVAHTVHKNHPVFKSIAVVDAEETWDYAYTASPDNKKKGAPKEAAPGDSEKNSIDFEWVKPAAASYPPIQLAPADAVAAAKKSTGQSDLSRAEVKKLPGAFVASPTQSTSLGDITIGVTNPVSQTAPGFVFQAQAQVSGNSQKDKVNRTLEKYGYNREDNANPTTDGDHVMEKQLGGPDSEDNVWPLNSSVNRSSGSRMKTQISEIKDKYKFKTIVGKFLRLKF